MSQLKLTVSDSVEVKADKIIFCFAVKNFGQDKDLTMKNGMRSLDNAVKSIKTLGVAENEIKIYPSRLVPRYGKREKSSFMLGKTTESVILDYTFTASIEIKLDVTSEILNELYISLLNMVDVYDVNFTHAYDNLADHEDELLTDMMLKAKAKAEVLSKPLGMAVTGVVEINKSVHRISVDYARMCNSASFDSLECCANFDESFGEETTQVMFSLENVPTTTLSDEVTVIFEIGKL